MTSEPILGTLNAEQLDHSRREVAFQLVNIDRKSSEQILTWRCIPERPINEEARLGGGRNLL